jgi:hypothetical protein
MIQKVDYNNDSKINKKLTMELEDLFCRLLKVTIWPRDKDKFSNDPPNNAPI